MTEVASRGDIEEAIIQCIIDCLPEHMDKIVLYGADNLREFKGKLKTFEMIKKKSNSRLASDKNKNLRQGN